MTNDDLHRPRPYCDWHEDHGDVLWWRMPISEAPYVGSPIDLGHTVEAHVSIYASDGREAGPNAIRTQVGGWPFSDTSNLWWTPLPDAKRIEDQVPL